MKKTIVVLALLIAAPAFALTVDCNDLGSGVVAIQYSGADVNNLPAAFGLSITADSGATLTLKSGSYKTDGESNSVEPGYGIYPGSINLTDPNNPVWNNPVADPCDEPAGDADGTGFVIVELGALYDDDSNAPLTSGTLCEFDVNVACTVTVQSEDTYRGGVVLEDGTTVDVDSNCLVTIVTDCLYVGRVFDFNDGNSLVVTQAMVDLWNDTTDPNYVNQASCWCCWAQQFGNGVYTTTSANRSDVADLAALKLSWFKRPGQAGYHACSDYDLSGRVDVADLAILKLNWFQRPGLCP